MFRLQVSSDPAQKSENDHDADSLILQLVDSMVVVVELCAVVLTVSKDPEVVEMVEIVAVL